MNWKQGDTGQGTARRREEGAAPAAHIGSEMRDGKGPWETAPKLQAGD